MEVPRHWRLKQQRYQMAGEICERCKTHLFPPRAVCPHCGGDSRYTVSSPRPEPVIAFVENAQPVNR